MTNRKAHYFIEYMKSNVFDDDELSGLKLFLENNAYDLSSLKSFLMPPALQVTSTARVSCLTSIKIAASVLLLISIFLSAKYYDANKNNSDHYWIHDEGFKVLMGAENKSISLANGMSYYKSENYKEAIRSFSRATKNDTASFYSGLCFLKLNELDSALKHLQAIPSSSVYKNKSYYYLAVCYLVTNEKNKAIGILKTCHFETIEMESNRYALLKEVNEN